MKLRTLPKKQNLHGKRMFVRVDWNIPLDGRIEPEASLKVERSLPLLRELVARGAIVLVLTHIGRPTKRESSLSTRRLVPLLKTVYHLDLIFHGESLTDKNEHTRLKKSLAAAPPGSIHLLENVRFETGEEKNSALLAKRYAGLADLFVNDAFASCRRDHASITGLTKHLPSYAGPALIEEIEHLAPLLKNPKRPFVAVVGGKKLSTKLPVVETLLKTCDTVMVGGAMAHVCLAAAGRSLGKSYLETDALKESKKLLQVKHLLLPRDVMVATKLKEDEELECVPVEAIGKKEVVVDVGYATLKEWGKIIQQAKTILWNGPIGVSEISSMRAGSRFMAKIIGARARGQAVGIAGGGDTIPVILETKTQTWFDFVSTGGGAMLEFFVKKGKLPGIVCLLK